MGTVLSGKERRSWLFVGLLKERLWGVTEQGQASGPEACEHTARAVHLPNRLVLSLLLAYYTLPTDQPSSVMLEAFSHFLTMAKPYWKFLWGSSPGLVPPGLLQCGPHRTLQTCTEQTGELSSQGNGRLDRRQLVSGIVDPLRYQVLC